MMVMLSNTRGLQTGFLAGKYEGRIGHLYSPDGWGRPYSWLPYALDNGRFAVWAAGKTWDRDSYIQLLRKAEDSGQRPLWVLVPDVVADSAGTLQEWLRWLPQLKAYGWPLAFAVQDGMLPSDVPAEAEIVFVGGSTEWKRRTLHLWTDAFPRVHVGRINTGRWLWECHEAGVESVDGTGYMRGNQKQLQDLVTFLDRTQRGACNPRGAALFSCRP